MFDANGLYNSMEMHVVPKASWYSLPLATQMASLPPNDVRDRSKSTWGTLGVVSALLAGERSGYQPLAALHADQCKWP